MRPVQVTYTLFRVPHDKILELVTAMDEGTEARITVSDHVFRGWITDIRINRDAFMGLVVTVEFEAAALEDNDDAQ